MKKTIIYYLVTAALILSLSSCGEKADDSSSEAEKTETKASVTSEAETISENEPVSESEPEIDLGFNGEFNEEVFEKICQNVRIGDKVVSFPFTLNDLGEEFEISDGFLSDEGDYACGLLYNGERIMEILIGSQGKEPDRDMPVYSLAVFESNIYNTDFLSKIEIANASIGKSFENMTERLGEANKASEYSTGKYIYEYSSDKGILAFETDNSGRIITIEIQEKV